MRRLALLLAATLLAACERDGARPTATLAPADTADQVIAGFEHHVTDLGVRRTRIEADTAYFYEATQTQLLRNVRAEFFDEEGRPTSTLTAREARYRVQDGSMRATGSVVVVGPDGERLASEELVYDKAAETISTEQAFRYDHRDEHLVGTGFRSDPAFENVVANQPRGTAGADMVLPGQ